MVQFKYQVQETINGVTLSYDGPEQDPAADPTTGQGDLEDYFLWMDGDTPATHVVMDVDAGNGRIKILARQAKQIWWKYRIHVNTQEFERRQKGDAQWSPRRPVTMLFIKVDGEANARRMESIGISNDNARIEHQGSNCSVTWNPATRRYVRRCVP